MKVNSWSHLYFLVFVSVFLVSSFPIFGTFQGKTQLSLFANFHVCIWSYLGTKTDRHLCQSVVVMVMLHTSIKHPRWSAINIYFSHIMWRWVFAHLEEAWLGSYLLWLSSLGLPSSSWYLWSGHALLTEMAEVKRANRTVQGLSLIA